MEIAVLLPCYNESKTIEKVVKDFARELPDAKIYVYDNNSKDNSGEIAHNAGAIVRKIVQQGKGHVVRRMFQEMTLHTLDKRFSLVEIPVTYRDRPAGSVSKLNTISDGFKVLKTIFNMFRFYRPFAFFGIIAIILCLAALGFGIPVFVEYFRTHLVERFPTLIFSCFLLTSSILSLGVALILDALKKQQDQNFELVLANTFKEI